LENIEEALTPDPQLQVAFSCEKPGSIFQSGLNGSIHHLWIT